MHNPSPRRWVTALPAWSGQTAKRRALGRNAANGNDGAGRKGTVAHNTGWRSIVRARAPLGLRVLPSRVAPPECDGSGSPMKDIVRSRPDDNSTELSIGPGDGSAGVRRRS
jgi:hypothetical protein